MTVYSIDVEVSTHDALQQGIVALPVMQSQRTYHRVIVDAVDDGDAVLIATQMACEVSSGIDRCDYMPTAAYLRV